MEQILNPLLDRARTNTCDEVNYEIDQKTRENILWFSREDPDLIAARIAELDKEWDTERVLILNASAISLASMVFGITKNRLWFVMPAVVSFFLAQHAIQGWCPPLSLFRKLGLRTRKEIDMEKYALMAALKSKKA